MDRVSIKLKVVDGFFGEVTIAINDFYAVGIETKGMYRWTNVDRTFFDIDNQHGIKIAGVDLIDNI